MKIAKVTEKLLSNAWKPLKLFTYEYTRLTGAKETQVREVYDKGDGAAVFMYNPLERKVLLTRQFRMPAYINGVQDGIMTEVPAGMLDADDPETCILKEIEEETGYRIPTVDKVHYAYMTPGAVTEKTYLFFGQYDASMKVSDGGGLVSEHEEIEVIEMSYEKLKKAYQKNEFTDAKTLLLIQYAMINRLLD